MKRIPFLKRAARDLYRACEQILVVVTGSRTPKREDLTGVCFAALAAIEKANGRRGCQW